ncbi:MAG: hypothetical protein A4E52_00308 [Pelotomaculum sp. PtaB.Bin013]|nr:MAG: hypothetical protein A4E52_00308 [Pelotomaculum sp. PtaB.Bin013]
MPDNKELVNMLRAVIQEELKPINERLDRIEQGQQETNKRLTSIEAAVNDLKAINRRPHKEAFSQLMPFGMMSNASKTALMFKRKSQFVEHPATLFATLSIYIMQ